jgi:hypothetical protein
LAFGVDEPIDAVDLQRVRAMPEVHGERQLVSVVAVFLLEHDGRGWIEVAHFLPDTGLLRDRCGGARDVLLDRHYRLALTLAPGAVHSDVRANPASSPSQIKGRKPADLWVAASGLPVRFEVKYFEPLNGIPGTGVGRTDYAAWSEPLNLDPTNLEWE